MRLVFFLLFALVLTTCDSFSFKRPTAPKKEDLLPSPSPPPEPAPSQLSAPVASSETGSLQKGFSELAGHVKPSVVNIATSKDVQLKTYNPWRGMDPFYGPFGQRQAPTQRQDHSLGTGFIIDAKGHVLTNNHVVEGADEIIVKLDDGRSLEAKIVGRDPRLDLAVLKLTEEGSYPAASMGDSDALNVGDWVVAVGNPFGLGQTVTAGIVSAKARVLGAGPYDDFIQTDASINPGNSGGPLFNLKGEVVGINTAIIASGQGIGFAIPVNMAKDIIPQLLATGTVSRGWLGVSIRDLTDEEAKKMALANLEGAMIAEVVPGGPADQAGIKPGDLIVEFNGQKVPSSHALPTLVAKKSPKEMVPVVFLHDGERFERNVTLGSLDDPEGSLSSGGEATVMGMKIRDLSPSERQRVRGGVVVTDVEGGGSAQQIGIQEGDLLVEINGGLIKSVGDFKNILEKTPSGQQVRVGLARGAYIYYFAFRKE